MFKIDYVRNRQMRGRGRYMMNRNRERGAVFKICDEPDRQMRARVSDIW